VAGIVPALTVNGVGESSYIDTHVTGQPHPNAGRGKVLEVEIWDASRTSGSFTQVGTAPAATAQW